MHLNFVYDLYTSVAPAGFKTALEAAALYLDQLITNPITVNISVGWGEDSGESLGGALATAGPDGTGVTYAQLKQAYGAHAYSAIDATIVKNLPATDPTGAGEYLLPYAVQKAWGMLDPAATEIDGTLGFSNIYPFAYDPDNRAVPGQYDFIGVAEHEIGHVLGRFAGLQWDPNWYSPLDLFRYAAPHTRSLTSGSTPSYLSIDNGATDIVDFDTFSDPGDWASSVTGDSFGAYANSDTLLKITTADTTVLDIQGYRIAGADGLFDAAYYLAHNPDVAAAGVDPYQHYMTTGWKEGRNPSALFDTKYYLAHNHDVAAAGVNPLTHYETYGWHEGRDPSLLFTTSAYLAANADVRTSGIDPLLQYAALGQTAGRTAALPGYDNNPAKSDPLIVASYFDPQLGATLLPTGPAAQAQAAELYNATGWKAGLNPDAWFDTSFYLTKNPDVRAAGMNPLDHFEKYGWHEGRAPSLVFDAAKYLAANADVRAAGTDPLLQFITAGQAEGRASYLTGGTAAADPLVNVAYFDAQLGATILPTGTAAAQQAAALYDQGGWQRGLNPDAWFNTAYYLTHNPDVAAAHMDPLLHYEQYGWHEGRDPSAQFSTNKYLTTYADVRAAGMDPLLHYVMYGQAEGRAAFTA